MLKNIVFIFQIMDSLYTAEEAAEILVNDDNDGVSGNFMFALALLLRIQIVVILLMRVIWKTNHKKF